MNKHAEWLREGFGPAATAAAAEIEKLETLYDVGVANMTKQRDKIERLEKLLADIRSQADASTEYVLAQINADLRKRVAELDQRVTDLGYDNLDVLIAAHQRNVAWLEQIYEALRLYRIPNKAEPQAFRDLTRAIQEPPS